MSISNELNNSSNSTLVKLENALDRLKEYDETDGTINEKLGNALSLFTSYFNTLSDPEFTPVHLKKGDVATSEDYNKNLKAIYNDLARFYEELNNFNEANNKAFNYSQVVINEIRKKAAQLSSIVLDLRILNGFTRGDVIVAGDDFINQDFINNSIGLGSDKAEILPGGAGLSLARQGTNSLSTAPNVQVQVIPISPAGTSSSPESSVNLAPTPGNLERFYEGNYYNFLGEARPEGGQFNLQSIVDTESLSGVTSGSFENTAEEVFVVEYGASEEVKAQARRKMIDGNPDTFWECEYLFKLSDPLQDDIEELVVVTTDPDDPANPNEAPSTTAVDINVNELNELALQEDTTDLVIDIIITLPFEQNVNFVSINPLLFSNKAYIEVIDISTTNDTQVDFETVQNWAELQFPKTITPEANEFLTDSQEGASLAPSKFAYAGQGVYPFPVTVANSVKIRLRMADPIAQIYERTYLLAKNTVDVKTTVTTKKSRGIFA